MSISTTELFRDNWGNKRVVSLLLTDSGAGTADEVSTGLKRVETMLPGSDKSTTVQANNIVHNEDFPFDGNNGEADVKMTIRMNANDVVNVLFIGI